MLDDLTGKQLDVYHLLRLLGRGAFGAVYEAKDLQSNAHVAVKVFEPFKTSEEMRRFIAEVNTLIRLSHPYIVPVRGFNIDEKTLIPFIAMQYAPNGTLRERHQRGEKVPFATVVHYITQLAEALQYIHNDKLIHRDVKPDNVLLGPNDELWLSDFGISTLTPSFVIDLNQPASQQAAGTPYYMAPEQCQGHPEKASDQYALAIMAYEWLCGYPPFMQGLYYQVYAQHIYAAVPSLRATRPDLSPQVETVILKALSKQPIDRYATIRDFAHALETAHNKPPIGTRLLTYRGHGDGKTAFAWSPDSKLFATGNASGLIELWDADTGTLVRTFDDVSTASIISLAWLPDGKRIVSASANNYDNDTVRVWEVSSGRVIQSHTPAIPHGYIKVVWSPDGKLAASTTGSASHSFPLENHTIRVWEVSSGQLVQSYIEQDMVGELAWSPNGKWIASSSINSKTVHVWEVSSGQLIQSYSGSGNVCAVAWSPDGKLIASGFSGTVDKAMQVWEVSSGQLVRSYPYSLLQVVWSPDGKWIASNSLYSTDTIQVWEINSGKIMHSYISGGRTNDIMWSPNGRKIASSSIANGNYNIRVWEVSSEQLVQNYSGRGSLLVNAVAVNAVAWSPDGQWIASGSLDVQVWDVNNGRLVQSYSGHILPVFTVTWSPDGKCVASASNDKTVQVWNVNSGQLVQSYSGHTDWVNTVAWSPNGKCVASGSADKTVQVWNVNSGQLVQSYSGHTDWVNTVAWSPNGKCVASGSADKTVHIWDVNNGQLVQSYGGYGVAWSPNGKYIAFTSVDETVQVWEINSRRLVQSYNGYLWGWSPDGKWIASGSDDFTDDKPSYTVYIWKIDSGQLVYSYTINNGQIVNVIVWSPDSTRLASLNNDCTVQIWQAV